MIYLKHFEGYLNDPLYQEISAEDASNFTKESIRKNIKEPITKDDYVKIHKIMYRLFDYDIYKINNETKDDFEEEVKMNIKHIFGHKDEDDPLSSLIKRIKESLEDGRIYFYIKRSNTYNYQKIYTYDINLYKIEGDIWILSLDSEKYYKLEGLEGLEDIIKNNEYNLWNI